MSGSTRAHYIGSGSDTITVNLSEDRRQCGHHTGWRSRLSSSRFSVLLPASSAQSLREAATCSASPAPVVAELVIVIECS